jgi:hypothetical protein
MAHDEIQRRLTLTLAEDARAVHAEHGGRCQQCRSAWPCEAYGRAHDTIARLTRPAAPTHHDAIGRARVHPRWTAGTD